MAHFFQSLTLINISMIKNRIWILLEYCRHYKNVKEIRGFHFNLFPRSGSGDVFEGTEDLGRYGRWSRDRSTLEEKKIREQMHSI